MQNRESSLLCWGAIGFLRIWAARFGVPFFFLLGLPKIRTLRHFQSLIRAFRPGRDAHSFGRGIIYHPESGVWRFCVKPANWSLALAISVFSFTAFSTPSA